MDSKIEGVSHTLWLRWLQQLVIGNYADRHSVRPGIVKILNEAHDVCDRIKQLIDLCLLSGGPDGIDTAIDVLSQCHATG